MGAEITEKIDAMPADERALFLKTLALMLVKRELPAASTAPP